MICNHLIIASLSRRGVGGESESRKHLPPRRVTTLNYDSKVIRRIVARVLKAVRKPKTQYSVSIWMLGKRWMIRRVRVTPSIHTTYNYEAARKVGGRASVAVLT